VPQVNLDSNFFDLGGHSLLLVEMHKQLEKSLRRRLPIVQLFQHATVRSLARYLTAESAGKPNLQDFGNRAQRQQRALRQRPRVGRK
jgi:acyl carrier protein